MSSIEKFKLREGVIFQDLGDEGLLLDTKTEEVYSFDPVARDIWLALQHTGNFDAALADTLRVYDVDAATLRRDMLSLLEKIAQAGLLEQES
jgi:hypothetical protein